MEVILSDSSKINSKGFKIDLTTLNCDRFKKNPVMLYQHDPYTIIGKWDNLRVEGELLKADAVFDTDDEEIKPIIEKIERGFLKGCSVGIHLTEYFRTNEEGINIARNAELLEASIVSIPSDAGAVILFDENHKELSEEEILKLYTNMEEQEVLSPDEIQLTLAHKEIEQLTAEVNSLKEENKKLKADIAQMEATKINDFLKISLSEGKINDKEFPLLAELAVNDFDKVKALINLRKAEKVESLSSMVKRSEPVTENYMDLMKNNPEKLQRLKHDNPEEFERLKSTL